VEELGQDRSSRRAEDVILAIEEKDQGSSHKEDSWKEELEEVSTRSNLVTNTEDELQDVSLGSNTMDE
jgi:hypothetical protein